MYDLNKVQLIGNITQDIELKQTPNGQNVCSFSLATNRSWTNEKGVKENIAEFHNIVLWGKLAEICGKYCQKGQKVYIEGRLQTRSWEAQDGTKRYKTEIIGENLIMLNGSGEAKQTTGIESEEEFEKKVKRENKKIEELSIDSIPF